MELFQRETFPSNGWANQSGYLSWKKKVRELAEKHENIFKNLQFLTGEKQSKNKNPSMISDPVYISIWQILTFCWPCISVYLCQYLTKLMHKICFTISFISCLYMFRAHVLIIRRSKLHYTGSDIITPIGVMIPEAFWWWAHVLETCRGME